MIIKTMGTENAVAYRDDSPDSWGIYFNPTDEIAVSIEYPTKFVRYGIHRASHNAVLKRLNAMVPEGYTWRELSWGREGSNEVVAIYYKFRD